MSSAEDVPFSSAQVRPHAGHRPARRGHRQRAILAAITETAAIAMDGVGRTLAGSEVLALG